MRTSSLILVGACAVLIGSCRSAEKAVTATSNTPLGVERKTVEFVQHSSSALKEQMAQWAREGWLVHSLVNVRQTENGGLLRRAELSRASASQEERKMVEFVQHSSSDLKEKMAQWAREGWLVLNTKRMSQADGTVLYRAELSRPNP